MNDVTDPAGRAGFPSPASLYDQTRYRIVDLLRNADRAALDTPVAACPGWAVRDVVAHLAGGLGDFLASQFDGVESGEWGERQVRDRRRRSVEENLAEWDTHRAAADPLFESPMAGVLVTEIVSHEHDIRAALGQPGARNDQAVQTALERPLPEIDRKLREAGHPAVRVVVPGEGERVLGEGQPARTLRVSAFELLRTIGGRRSGAQIRALDWEGEPEADALTLFGTPREDDLVE